jgi:hypothetical protein
MKDETDGPTEAIENASDALKIMGLIGKRRRYFQIPFITQPEGPASHAELTVFGGPDSSRSYSALAAVDTLYLKRTEFYIRKINGQVTLSFRCENDRALSLLSAGASKLRQALKNIPIGSVTFEKLTEPFAFTGPEPYTEAPAQEGVKRFTFDMRV